MINRIKEILSHLENSKTVFAGIYKQRYSETSECDAYLGVRCPENYRMLVLRTPYSIGKNFSLNYEFKGLKFEKAFDQDDSGFVLLNLVLINGEFKDVFDSLIFDVLNHIINETEISRILKNYGERLVKWQSLFESFNKPGLSPEEQRGLFGELYFLRKFLQNKSNYSSVVSSWVGTEKQVRDFLYDSWSVEVKTSVGNNHQKIHISSERQLDISNVENLFLFHLSFESRQNSGESLNELVNSVSEILSSDVFALNGFKRKLLEGGYFDHHKSLYDVIGYVIRQELFFEVRDDFPRIEEKDIRYGVGDVKYTIILSQCSGFFVSEQQVFQTIQFL